MARMQFSLTLEMELAYDALDTVLRVHELLARRHGEAFRRLERRIEALGDEGGGVGAIDMSELESGRFVVAPPAGLLEVIAEARRLGVISA